MRSANLVVAVPAGVMASEDLGGGIYRVSR
jgi:hypothetical protein